MAGVAEATRNLAELRFRVYGEPRAYQRPESGSRGGRHAFRSRENDTWMLAVRRAALDALDVVFDPDVPVFGARVPLALRVAVFVERPVSHYLRPWAGDACAIAPPVRGRTAIGLPDSALKRGAPVYPTGKPDASNYLKEIEDALGVWPAKGKRKGRALAYGDDAQIVSTFARKFYCPHGSNKNGAKVLLGIDLNSVDYSEMCEYNGVFQGVFPI